MDRSRNVVTGGVGTRVRVRGQPVAGSHLWEIREMVAAHPDWTRTELCRGLCRLWNWRRPNGELRMGSCRLLLLRLERLGQVRLPAAKTRPGRWKPVNPGGISAGETPGLIESVELGEVEVRLVRGEEVGRWREWMANYHYLGDGRLVGENLRYVAEWRGQWLALSGWAAAAMKSRWREAYVGWDSATRWERLYLVANHVRFLILPWVRVPNVASFVLARNVHRLSADWEAAYGHPILLVETFVDLGRFRGSCYRAANWKFLGETRGYGKSGQTYQSHGEPKGLFIYPLHPRAKELLSSPFPPCFRNSKQEEAMTIDVSQLPIAGQGGLMELLSELSDPRGSRGKRHPLRSVLGVAVCAVLSGQRSFLAIADYAASLPWETLRLLGFRRKDWGAPSEPTIRRVLQRTDAVELDQKVGQWLQAKGLVPGQGLAVDGKTLRGSQDGQSPPRHLLSAVLHEEGLVVAQHPVDQKSNEITALQPLLAPLDLKGAVVTADAMHTQKETARYLVEEKDADYVFIAKDNQTTLREDIATVDWDAFPPSADRQDRGQRPRPD